MTPTPPASHDRRPAMSDEAAKKELSFGQFRDANVRRNAEWGMAGKDLSYRGVELGGEVGEALNVIKKLERERLGHRGSRATLKELETELADVVIAVDLIAMELGIDLAAALVEKFNATSSKYGLSVRLNDQ